MLPITLFFLVSAVGATSNKYVRCRSLAFPSAADLFDVQTSHPEMSIYPGLTPFAIRCRTFGAYFRRIQVDLTSAPQGAIVISMYLPCNSLPKSMQLPFFAYSMKRTFTEFGTDLKRNYSEGETELKMRWRILNFAISRLQV